MWHKRPFVPLPAKSFYSALEEQFALIAFERVNICSSLTPIGRCQVLVYMCKCVCVFTYHCSIVEGRRRCPRGPAPSGPSGLVRSVRSAPVPWAQDARTGRTGPDRTGPQITSSLFFLFEKRWSGAPKQAFGPKVMECCSKTSFWTKSDGVLLQNKLLEQK